MLPFEVWGEHFDMLCFAFFGRFAVLVNVGTERTQRVRRFWGASSHFAAAPGSGTGMAALFWTVRCLVLILQPECCVLV